MEYTFDRFIREKIINKINVYQRYTFIAAIITGICAHSFAIFNKISYHDDSFFYFDVGYTFSLGRWGLGIIKAAGELCGLGYYSMPVWNGMWSILLLAVCALLIVGIIKLENKIYAVLIGAYMTAFPAITSTFAYMFTAPYYFFAALCMVLSVGFTVKYKKGFLGAVPLIAFGMGIYQAYFGMATALLVMILIKDFPENSFEENLKKSIKYFLTLISGIVSYFLMNKVCIAVTNEELKDYQGISGMEDFSLTKILIGIKEAYMVYFKLVTEDFVGITNNRLIRAGYLMCFLLFLVLAFLIFKHLKGLILNKILYGVLLILAPLSITVISVMAFSEDTYIHTLMIYDFVFIAIYPIVLLQAIQRHLLNKWEGKLIEWLHGVTCITLAVMILLYIRLDNAAYLKANYQQENAISYHTVLISEIKGTDGYCAEFPVVFLGSLDGMDASIAHVPEFENITLQGYNTNMNEFMTYYASSRFRKIHCGYQYFTPDNLDEIKASEYVKNMPCYPKQGSIEVIDDVVVVKFSNNY